MGMVTPWRKKQKAQESLWRDDLWDALDILYQSDDPVPEGKEMIELPDYDYDGGFTDEEIL